MKYKVILLNASMFWWEVLSSKKIESRGWKRVKKIPKISAHQNGGYFWNEVRGAQCERKKPFISSQPNDIAFQTIDVVPSTTTGVQTNPYYIQPNYQLTLHLLSRKTVTGVGTETHQEFLNADLVWEALRCGHRVGSSWRSNCLERRRMAL